MTSRASFGFSRSETSSWIFQLECGKQKQPQRVIFLTVYSNCLPFNSPYLNLPHSTCTQTQVTVMLVDDYVYEQKKSNKNNNNKILRWMLMMTFAQCQAQSDILFVLITQHYYNPQEHEYLCLTLQSFDFRRTQPTQCDSVLVHICVSAVCQS